MSVLLLLLLLVLPRIRCTCRLVLGGRAEVVRGECGDGDGRNTGLPRSVVDGGL